MNTSASTAPGGAAADGGMNVLDAATFLFQAIERIGPYLLVALVFAYTNLTNARKEKTVAEAQQAAIAASAGSTNVINRMAESYQERNIDLEKMLAKTQELVHQKTLQIVELQGTLTDTTLTLGHRERELKDTQDALEAIKSAKSTQDEQIAVLTAELKTLKDRVETLEKDLANERQISDQLTASYGRVEAALTEAIELRKKAEALADTLRQENDRLTTENTTLTERLAVYEEEKRDLTSRIEQLERTIEGMRHETSEKQFADIGDRAADGAADSGHAGAGHPTPNPSP